MRGFPGSRLFSTLNSFSLFATVLNWYDMHCILHCNLPCNMCVALYSIQCIHVAMNWISHFSECCNVLNFTALLMLTPSQGEPGKCYKSPGNSTIRDVWIFAQINFRIRKNSGRGGEGGVISDQKNVAVFLYFIIIIIFIIITWDAGSLVTRWRQLRRPDRWIQSLLSSVNDLLYIAIHCNHLQCIG